MYRGFAEIVAEKERYVSRREDAAGTTVILSKFEIVSEIFKFEC